MSACTINGGSARGGAFHRFSLAYFGLREAYFYPLLASLAASTVVYFVLTAMVLMVRARLGGSHAYSR